MTQDYTDRRRHERIDVVRAIFIEVAQRGVRSEAHNTIIRCETVDISVSGLRVHVSEAIAPGSHLNIAVPMEDWTDNLELVGEAMWAKPAENEEGFWVGLELRDSNPEDMKKWFEVVQRLSAAARA